MIKIILKVIATLGGILAIFIAHSAVVNFLPFPINRINIVYMALLWLTVNKGTATVIWLALILSFLTELFSSTPFGVDMAALLMSLIFLNWFLLNIFTSHSWYTVFFSGLIGFICYRVLGLLFLVLAMIVGHGSLSFNYRLITNFLLEAALTSLTLTLLYLIASLFKNRLNPKYITLKGRL
ncbi:MAG: hypothetical protein A2754_00230 [Candidatus Magasanikbacteria bacterium RIFCSPHIGHO2_01_FULL_47_8]|uniref:Rod shape-determining protein MreD n=1 Tax=Candidatus Magasanikbacteria bacterium RIFCSPHIGHO2_01_FULL_47_8 TaxID=1798673 RepID=A0A1F6MFS8_9BACT|nr:MAG: hypothetical protein A2754_00230 [Candidatus Magasanikbacteria bacterium RIFCSPHIGHO2_01_FULL_47_8]